MASLEPYLQLTKDMLKKRHTCTDISSTLHQLGVQRGSSEMSVRRFCTEHNLGQRGVVSDTCLEIAISKSISEVCRLGYGIRYVLCCLAYVMWAHWWLFHDFLSSDRIDLQPENDDRLPVLSGGTCWRLLCGKHFKDSSSSLSWITKMCKYGRTV